MQNRIQQYAAVMWQLLKTDFVVFRQNFLDDVINIFVWLVSFVAIVAHIYPKMGLTSSFGMLFAFSMMAGESYWRIWNSSFLLIDDLEGKRIIDYYCTLPIPSWMVFLKEILAFMYKSLIFGAIMFPILLILLGDYMVWDSFSSMKLIFMFLAATCFTATMFLFLSSFIVDRNNLRKIGIRILFPLWMSGAAEFPYRVIQAALPTWAGSLLLLNPVIYLMEGMHNATLGPSGFFPFWICMVVTLCVSVAFGIVGIIRFKRRLDLV
ncbi:hypothetical protein JW872_01410 [Candidatus Babeliales bacterium]|nr:hypothetical protein [Candidatus Babeliales bacterium]